MFPTVAYISLSNLRHNYHQIQKRSGGNSLWVVLKANAYGHGAVPLAQSLLNEVTGICVATLYEAIELRKNGIDGRILVMGLPLPQWLKHYQNYDLELNVGSFEMAELVRFGAESGLKFAVHLKLDTGMHRLGVSAEEVFKADERLSHPNISKKGFWSHLAVADEVNPFNALQIQRFFHIAAQMGDGYEQFHLGNSGGSLYHTAQMATHQIPTHKIAFRAGLALYGISPMNLAEGLKPVMTLQSVVVQCKEVKKGESVSYGQKWFAPKDTKIAIVNAGYADGFPREVQAGTMVKINDELFPIVGRVCMDMLMVEIGDANVQVGDPVELWGETVSIWEIAKAAHTIPYTLLTGVPQRVKRLYLT